MLRSLSQNRDRRDRTLEEARYLQRVLRNETKGEFETLEFLVAKLERTYIDFPSLEMMDSQRRIIGRMEAEIDV